MTDFDNTQGNQFDFEDPERFEESERPWLPLGSDALWCRNVVDSLKVGGIWGVPRSGLVFTKTGWDSLALTDRLPHMEGMPITAEQVREQQDNDYAAISSRMAEAGISVSDTTTKEQA